MVIKYRAWHPQKIWQPIEIKTSQYEKIELNTQIFETPYISEKDIDSAIFWIIKKWF